MTLYSPQQRMALPLPRGLRSALFLTLAMLSPNFLPGQESDSGDPVFELNPFVVETGSQDDPEGKEGLAALTAARVNTDLEAAPTWDSGDTWQATMQHIAREGGCWVVGCATSLEASDIPEDVPFHDERRFAFGTEGRQKQTSTSMTLANRRSPNVGG